MGRVSRLISDSYVALKGLFRYKSMMFWVIVFPILFYMLMVGIWGSPSAEPISVGVINLDNGYTFDNGTKLVLGDILVRSMNESGIFRVKKYSNTSGLLNAIRHGEVEAGLVIPPDFTTKIVNVSVANITVYYMEGQYGEYYKGYIMGFLSRFSDQIRNETVERAREYTLSNISEDIRPYVDKWFTFIESPVKVDLQPHTPEMLATKEGIRAFYAIGMIAVEVLFIGLSVGTTSIISMKRDNTLQIVLSSPMRNWEILLSQSLSALLMIGISSISILLVSLAMGAKYYISFHVGVALLFLLLVGALFTIGLGLMLAALARTEEAAMAIVNGIAFPVMFVGGLVIPEFVLPEYLRVFSQYYPLSRSVVAIRKMLIYGSSPWEALSYALPAIVSTVLIFIVGSIIFNKLLIKSIES